MWVVLNGRGRQVWGDVFPDGRVPIMHFGFEQVELEGCGSTRVALVNWAILSEDQRDLILSKLSLRFRESKRKLSDRVLRDGLPLLESCTTGVVAAELRSLV